MYLRTVNIRAFVFIVCISFAWGLAALDPTRSIDQYVVEQWTTANGLPGNSVVAISQTPDGYLWVGTRRQLTRFNGIKFTPYRLFNAGEAGYKEITAVRTDIDGDLWIGTRGPGLFKFKDEVFEIFTQKDGLSSSRLNSLYGDVKNNLWIGTDDGYLNCLKGDKFINYNKENGLDEPYIYSVAEDSRGNLWVGTRGGGLYRFTNGRFIKIPIKDFDVYDVTALKEDSNGTLWIGTNRGLVRFDGQNVELLDKTRGLYGHEIYTIIEDSDGNLWIGTGNGLFRIQKEKNPTAAPATERLMTGSVVRTIFEDREKSIWIGTDGRGLARLRDGKIRTFSVESGLPHEYVVFMHEDRDKNIRVATMDGLVRFDNGRLHRDAMKIEFTDAVVGPICCDQNGNTWFGTYGSGLYVRLPNGRLVNYTISNGLRSDSIISLLSDSRGTLWVGTSRGLNVFENGRFKSYNDKARLLENEIYCIYEDNKNAVWIGTNKGLTVSRNGDFWQPGAGKLPPNSIISYIYQDGDGIFWIATKGNGLIRLEGENHVTTFTTRSGLNSNTIYQLFEDDDGYFWMSCDKGIFKVTRKSLNDLAASHTLPAGGTAGEPAQKIDYLYYGQSDGMKARECSRWGQHSSIKTSGGKLLFGTPKGISIIDPRNIKINKIPPSVLIQRVVVNNRALELNKINDRFVFKTFDFIQFHFTASTLISPERTIFRYKLENHDTGWTPVKANQIKMAHYRKLEPGEYTFRVMAANSDGIWGEKGASFTFYYTPRFTGSPAFKIILGLLILLAGVLLFLLLKKYRRYLKSKSKYKDSALETEVVESCMKKLLYVMDIEKLYKDDKLSLQTLAQKVSVTSHILSQVINEQLNKNFSDFVNSYRIEEAKKMLQEADEDTSILHICYEVGFNSKSAFYRAFKKFTDKTPSQYQKDLFNR